MNYFEFKKRFQADLENGKITANNPLKQHCFKILFSVEQSFNNVFEHYIKDKQKNTPKWLFKMFDSFVRLVEDNKISLKAKKNKALILSRNLFQQLSKYNRKANLDILSNHLNEKFAA